MTSAENRISEPLNLKRPPYKARAFTTRNSAPGYKKTFLWSCELTDRLMSVSVFLPVAPT